MAKQFPALGLAVLLWAALCAAVLTGCGGDPAGGSSADPAPPVSAGVDLAESGTNLSAGGVYTDPDKDYQVTIPEGWKQDGSQENDRVLFRSPDGTRSVELKKQPPDCNLLAYAQSDFTETYAGSLPDFRLQSFQTIRANGSRGVSLRYTCTQDGARYAVLQYVMAGKYDYNITYSALDGDDPFVSLAEGSIGTFRELDPDADPSLLTGRLNGRVYTAQTGAYTLTLPKNWRISEQEDDCVVFVSSDRKRNINIRTSPIDKRLFRYQKSYFTSHFQELFGKSASLTSFSTTTINGEQALYLACRYTHRGQHLESRQYSINQGDVTYTITCTATTADIGNAGFEEVAETFQLA